MKINFREASTKRAIVMVITGCITLYNIVFGSGASDVDVLVHRVEWWMGIGITIVGMLGFLPDQPTRDPQERTRETDLPEISLVGRSESTIQEGDSPFTPACDTRYDNSLVLRVRAASLQPDDEHQAPGSVVRQDGCGYNG